MNMMDAPNSSVEELIIALQKISGFLYSFNKHAGINKDGQSYLTYTIDGIGTALDLSEVHADVISKKFLGVNKNLSAAWEAVGTFVGKINQQLVSEMSSFAEQMLDFANQTIANEDIAAKAANQAVSASEEILNQLNIN